MLGEVTGNVTASDKVDIRKDAKLVGDITTARISIETHINPAEAFSDGPNQIPLGDLAPLLKRLLQIHSVVN